MMGLEGSLQVLIQKYMTSYNTSQDDCMKFVNDDKANLMERIMNSCNKATMWTSNQTI